MSSLAMAIIKSEHSSTPKEMVTYKCDRQHTATASLDMSYRAIEHLRGRQTVGDALLMMCVGLRRFSQFDLLWVRSSDTLYAIDIKRQLLRLQS
jgi:hypothetical protein